MIQHVVLITFKDGLEQRLVDEFLTATEEYFADTPFESVVHGTGLDLVINGADWGYVGTLAGDDITVWREHPSHIRLRDHVSPLTGQVNHIQLAV